MLGTEHPQLKYNPATILETLHDLPTSVKEKRAPGKFVREMNTYTNFFFDKIMPNVSFLQHLLHIMQVETEVSA